MTGVMIALVVSGWWVLIGALGWRFRPPSRPAARRSVHWRGVGFGAVVLMLGGLVGWPGPVVATMLWFGWRANLPRRRARRHHQRVIQELPEVIDFFRVAILGGLTPVAATDAVARRLSGTLADALGTRLHRVALGARFSDELESLPVELGPELRELSRVLVSAERHGVAVAPALERLAEDSRMVRRREAETAARRLPVKLLFPLVVCTLPAFLLLTVVPIAVTSLRALTPP